MDRRRYRASVLSGWVAGVTTTILLSPLDFLRTRFQVVGARYDGRVTRLAIAAVRNEGVLALFKGMSLPVLAQGVYKSIIFTSFNFAKTNLVRDESARERWWSLYACGAFAGTVNTVVVTPVELVRNRLMMQERRGERYSGPIDCAMKTVRSEGWRGMYRGYRLAVLRDSNLGMWFLTFHTVKRLGWGGDNFSTPVAGACAGVAFWTFALPFDALKSATQASLRPRAPTAREVFHENFSGSVRKLYGSYRLALSRGIPAASLTFTVQSHVYARLTRGEEE